jgi:hypothetical protein
MADFVNRLETFTNAIGVHSGLTQDADDGRMGLRSNPPYVQVRDGGIPRFLDQFADLRGNLREAFSHHSFGVSLDS